MKMFSELQRGNLKASLSPTDPRIRTGDDGIPYFESHEVVDSLNTHFGYGMWDFMVLSFENAWEGQIKNHKGEINNVVTYLAHGRLTVRDEEGNVCQYDGVGSRTSFSSERNPPNIDTAFKGAVSNAMKRAAYHLGNQFGNSLRDKDDIHGTAVRAMDAHFNGSREAASPPAAPSADPPSAPAEQAQATPNHPPVVVEPAPAPASAASQPVDAALFDKVGAAIKAFRRAHGKYPKVVEERALTTPSAVRALTADQMTSVLKSIEEEK